MEFTGWSLPKRLEFIEKMVTEESDKKYSFRFQDKFTQFNVYRIPIELSKYRLENGRTLASQEEHIYKNDLSEDFFEDAESVEAQLEQHNILKGMLKSPRDLLKYFIENEQDYPLILTRLGFVVNGNRRLCTMRELLQEDEQKFSRYRHIDVVFLPHCSEEDIDRLEAELQLEKDIKADYNWVSEAYMLRNRHVKHRKSFTELATTYNISEKDVQAKLDLLAYVDQYLENIGVPKQYNEVMKDEFAFKQFKKNRDKLKGDAKKEIFTNITFSIISMPREEGRLWEYIPKIADNIDPIIDRLTNELKIESDQITLTELDAFFEDGLDDDESKLDKLVINLNENEDRDTIIHIVREVVDTEEELKDEKEAKDYVFKMVKKANTILNNAYLALNEDSSADGIVEQFKNIEDTMEKIRKAINGYG